jgi:hypothetical protein
MAEMGATTSVEFKGNWDFAFAAQFAAKCIADAKPPPLGNFCRAGYEM